MNSFKKIKKLCDNALGIDIAKDTRKTEYIRGRQIFYRLCQTLTMSSASALGRFMGIGHATVLHALNNFQADILEDEDYGEIYFLLKEKCTKMKLGQSTNTNKLTYRLREIINNLNEEIIFIRSEKKSDEKYEDAEEKELVSVYNSLSPNDRANAIFKLRTMAKVSKKLERTA